MIFRQVDLGQCLHSHMKAVTLNCAAVRIIEGIADLLALLVGEVGHLDVYVPIVIGGDYQHVAKTVCEQIVHDISLDIVVVPGLSCLSRLVYGGYEFVHVRLSVHGIPKTFTVSGVVSTTKGLFITVVEERNTASS